MSCEKTDLVRSHSCASGFGKHIVNRLAKLTPGAHQSSTRTSLISKPGCRLNLASRHWPSSDAWRNACLNSSVHHNTASCSVCSGHSDARQPAKSSQAKCCKARCLQCMCQGSGATLRVMGTSRRPRSHPSFEKRQVHSRSTQDCQGDPRKVTLLHEAIRGSKLHADSQHMTPGGGRHQPARNSQIAAL